MAKTVVSEAILAELRGEIARHGEVILGPEKGEEVSEGSSNPITSRDWPCPRIGGRNRRAPLCTSGGTGIRPPRMGTVVIVLYRHSATTGRGGVCLLPHAAWARSGWRRTLYCH